MPTQTRSLSLPQTDTGWLKLEGHAPLQSVVEAENAPELLKQVLRRSYTWQERNDVSIRQAALSPDRGPMWAAALMAWNAQALFENGESVPYAAYLHRQARGQGRMIGLLIPPEGEGLHWGVAEVARTRRDVPIVAAVAVVALAEGQVQEARVALTGVWKRSADLAQAPSQLVGQALTPEAIAAVAQAIAAETDPRPNFLGSVAYRRAMAEVLSRDALEQCVRQI
jgi:CO/xanthine dehydrogenase FAD-binding subunit